MELVKDLEVRSSSWVLNLTTRLLIRDRKEDKVGDGRVEIEAEITVMSTSQEMPQIASNHQKPGERPGTGSLQRLQKELTLPTPRPWPSGPSTVREQLPVVFTHAVCGHLLRQRQETQTGSVPNACLHRRP